MKTVKTPDQNIIFSREIVNKARHLLQKAKIPFPESEAELLFSIAVQRPLEFLYAHPEYRTSPSEKRRFESFVRRRCSHEPVAYIANLKEFYHHTFYVNRHALIPRPETEELVSLSFETWKKLQTKGLRMDIIDIGTGSGAIILSLAKTILASRATRLADRFYAMDSSKRALNVAQQNAKRLGIEQSITFLHGNLLEPYFHRAKSSQYQIILANLPYLTADEMKKLQPEVRFEPKKALAGGKDGLDAYRSMFRQIVRARIRFTAICEIAPQQKKPLSRMIEAAFPSATIEFLKDFAGRTRFVRITEESF